MSSAARKIKKQNQLIQEKVMLFDALPNKCNGCEQPYDKLNPPSCRQQVIIYGDALKYRSTLPPGNPTFVNTVMYADYDEVLNGTPVSGVEVITVPMRTWSNGQVF